MVSLSQLELNELAERWSAFRQFFQGPLRMETVVMSSILDRVNMKDDPWEGAQRACAWMKDDYPETYAVLTGRPKSKDSEGVLPGSIRLFTNGGELKAVIGGKEWLMDGYIVLAHGVTILAAIEAELQQGRIGWKATTERKPSY